MTGEVFKSIYLPLSDGLYKVAYYILESRSDAEDAVQDLYIKLWESIDRLDKVENPKAYALRLIHNLCIDRMRRAQTFPERENLHENIPEPGIVPGIVDDDAAEKLQVLMRKIEELPRKQREVVKRRIFAEEGYDTISEQTGMSQGNIRTLLSIARKTLKSKTAR